MKDIKNTAIFVGIIIIVLSVALLIVNNAQYGVDLLTRTTLDKNDPTIQIALEKISKTKNFRTANYESSKLENEEKINFILENIEKDDYKSSKVKHQKLICEVTDRIYFQTEEKDCNIRTIKNSTIVDLEEKYFNTRNINEFPEIRYHEYYCKNDGTKYYCQIIPYSDTIIDYSAFESAYQEKDKVVIYEYYLRIDLSDKTKCKKYLNEDYCNNNKSQEKPEIDEDTIKKDGVLYMHVFKETENSYYLEQSKIVTKR